MMTETMCDRLKRLRFCLRSTQQEMASFFGFAQSYYSEIEKGRKRMPTRCVLKLSSEKNVSADWLLNGSGNMFLGGGKDVLAKEFSTTTATETVEASVFGIGFKREGEVPVSEIYVNVNGGVTVLRVSDTMKIAAFNAGKVTITITVEP